MRIFLILLTFLWTTLAFAEAPCGNGRQFIFLVHGIGGSPKHFGYMETYLNKLDHCFRAKSFEYQTGDSRLTTHDFSLSLHSYIEQEVFNSNINSNDRISLIMHSQGGLVGSQWLYFLKESNHYLLKNIDAFITLSTPYWGASMARIGKRFFYTLPEDQDKNPISPFGKKELEEMSYGSASINKIEDFFESTFSLPGLRPLAIGGLKRGFNPYTGEDDMAVSVYSSRPDHFILRENTTINGKPTTVGPEKFYKTDLVPFIPVKATHIRLDLPGIADIPAKCLITRCKHPSLDYIVNHLNRKHIDLPDMTKMFRKYRVQVFLENWSKFLDGKDDVTVDLIKPDGGEEKIKFNFRSGSEISTSFSGILEDYGQHTLTMIFKIRGKVVKTVRAPVQGGLTTFVKLSLN